MKQVPSSDENRSKCLNNPCKNDGKCVPIEKDPGYKCECKGGYFGDKCEGNIRFYCIATLVFIVFVVSFPYRSQELNPFQPIFIVCFMLFCHNTVPG